MRLLENAVADIRYTVRGLRRAPVFAWVAISMLALGIGANTAIFSVVYGVWLSPANYEHAGRLVDLSMQELRGHRFLRGVSFPDLEDWKAQAGGIEAFGLHLFAHQVDVSGAEGAEEVIGHRVSSNLFPLLGATPVLGRYIEPSADRAAGPREALIGYGWWQRHFGGDPHVVGRQIRVDGEPFTITGVMPRRFEFPPMGSDEYRPVLWMSLNLSPAQESPRGLHFLGVVARLKPGASISSAQAQLAAIEARLANAYPREDGGLGVRVSNLTDSGQLEHVRPALLLALAAACVVLMIACANVANLLLARAAGREHEMAVRRALGVSRARLMQQLLTESVILSLGGGAAGILLVLTVLPAVKALLPADMPRAAEIGLRAPVLVFTTGVSMLTGVAFGLLPAIRSRAEFAANRAVAARNRPARLLVIGELALALVLMACAGLLVASFWRLVNVNPGFRADHVLTARLQLDARSYPDSRRIGAFRDELLRRVCALPGVRFAGTVSSAPMGIIEQGTDFETDHPPSDARERPFASFANVSTDYLRAMGIRLLYGRYFSGNDGPGSEPVTIISESLARVGWRSARNAVGKRIRFDDTWFTVVGVVADVRQDSLEEAGRRHIYALNPQLPLRVQGGPMGRLNVLVIRTATDPAAIAAALRKEVAEIDRDQPVAQIATMAQVVQTHLQPQRLNTVLMCLLASLSVVLAAVGVFALVSYSMARRTKEIGIRIALGATPARVFRSVSRELLLLTAMGTAAGLAATIATSRLLRGFLFDVKPFEPAILMAAAALMAIVVLVAGLLPARRATLLDPVQALRQDQSPP